MTRVGVRWFFIAFALAVALPARRAAADTIPADKLPEPAINTPMGGGGKEGQFLRDLHAHIHRRWSDNFLHLVGEKLPLINPLNDSAKAAEADLVVSGDGQLISAKITRSSGFPGFDDAIIEVLHDAVPFPTPPSEARSDDDRLHVHWQFARDQRRCSGVTILHINDAMEVALPKLLKAGRRDEALRRLSLGRSAGLHAEPAFTQFANDWVKAAIHQPSVTVQMAKLLGAAGDPEAIKWLKSAVRRPDVAAEAGAALVSLKIPLCPMLAGWFDTDNWTDHKTAAVALATSTDPACVPGLSKLLSNDKAHPEARAAAATALGSIDDPAAKKLLVTVAKDERNAAVRGAALLATIKPGSGRAKVIAMEQLLRDTSPDLRAAAAAGVVRAGGDANLDDLYVLFKDNDQRPSLAALRELDRLLTEESTKLVARLARRPQPAVQKLAAEILLRRGARDYFSALKPYLADTKSDPELRAMALVAADEAHLQSAGADPKLGLAVFRARLARGERDQAADLFLAHGAQLTPADQAAAMVEWLATGQRTPLPPPSLGSKPSATR
jgi:TonB family protein